MSIVSARGARASLLFIALIAALLLAAPAALAAPDNDDFSAATPLTPGFGASGNNNEATKETGEPQHAGEPGGHSVWFSWTPSKSGTAGVNTGCFDSLDAAIGVYIGPDVDALTEVASNADGPPPLCFSVNAEVEFAITAGTTYWIAVDGKNGDQGSFNLTLRGPPANDDLADATVIAADPPQSISSATRHATEQLGEPDHAGEPGGHSVWFSWTPDESQQIEISTCTNFMTPSDTVVAVYTGSELGSLTAVASNDDAPVALGSPGCRETDSAVAFDAVAGTTYRIAVDGAGESATTSFSLGLRGRPENDDFATPATLIPSLPATSSQIDNRMATKETGEPQHAGEPGGHSVWFSWTPAQSGRVGAFTCTREPSGEPDTLLAVYTGSSLGGLTEVASSDDPASSSCGGTDSAVAFDAVAGTTYRIAVDAKGDPGRFALNLESIGSHDAFATPRELTSGLPASILSSTLGASKETGEPDHAGQPGGHSVWFSWTPDTSRQVLVSVCPYVEAGSDTLLAIYTGSSLNALTEVAANDDSSAACRDGGSVAKLNAVAGTTYRIAVDGKLGSVSRFALQLLPPGSNDDFAAAEPLSPESSGNSGANLFATKQAGEPDHAGDSGGHSVWYEWTPDTSGVVEISACGRYASVDTLLAVYTGASVNALTEVAASDDASSRPEIETCEDWYLGNSTVSFNAVAGTTYRIAVDTKGGVEGGFVLRLDRAPRNDALADAQDMTTFPLPTGSNNFTKHATKEAGEPQHAGNPGGHSVWFSWTAAKTGPISVGTCTHTGKLDTLLAVYTGASVNALTAVAANDDSPASGCRSSDSQLVLNAVAGTIYLIAVDGKGGSTGGFNLKLEGAAANDSFGKPLAWGGLEMPIETWTDNNFATKQAGEPDHAGAPGGASVWIKWSAPRSGKVSIDTCGSGFDTLLAVYTGASVNALTEVAANDDGGGKCGLRSKLSFDAVANTPYRIAIDGKDGATGTARIYISEAPTNDAFAKPHVIAGTHGWWSRGATMFAGKEPGEPDHAGEPGGHSVWFSWTPKASGPTELNVCSTGFDPVLGIYTGNAVDALTPVATTDLGAGECETGRALRFDALADTTYRFAVDGADGDTGHFDLHITAASPQPRSLVVAKAGAGAGTVSSSPDGIDCGSACSAIFQLGTVVTLSANPAAGSTFAGWSGGGCSGSGSCQVTLGADTTVTATFQPTGGSSDGGGASGAGTGGGTIPIPKPKPLKCKPGFKKAKVKGKQKCVKKKKPAKGRGKGKSRGQRR